jgi:uncharacterized protein
MHQQEELGMGNRIINFEVAAEDGERAKKFYEAVLGWKFKKWEGAEADDSAMHVWMIQTGAKEEPGIDGALLLRSENPKTGQVKAFFCTIAVDDIEEAISKVERAGGKILGKMEMDEMGQFASAEDTEGNKFGILQPSKK